MHLSCFGNQILQKCLGYEKATKYTHAKLKTSAKKYNCPLSVGVMENLLISRKITGLIDELYNE
jgi:hypothetical protein